MLNDVDVIIHRLRLRYLSQVQDGVGERIITGAGPKTNGLAFKAAGGDQRVFRRCYSPEITAHEAGDFSVPVAITRERSDSVPRSNTDEAKQFTRTVGEMVTEFNSKMMPRFRRADSMAKAVPRDDEASDQSGESDMDESPLALEEPKFAKISIRRRGASDTAITYQLQEKIVSKTFFIGSKESEEPQSQPIEKIQNFMDIPEEREFAHNKLTLQLNSSPSNSFSRDALAYVGEDVGDDSDVSVTDSEFGAMNSLPDSALQSSLLKHEISTPVMEDAYLNKQPRPISYAQPISLLTAMIQAQSSAVANPLEERFGILSGKGDLKPLKLKIYRPSSNLPSTPYMAVIRSNVTVADTIGFALLRYMEEDRLPKLTEEQCNPNQWTLRIVEEGGELDEDFPALDRTRPISKFSFDEFALVEAMAIQISENEAVTPTPIATKRLISNSSTDLLHTTPTVSNTGPDTCITVADSFAPSAQPPSMAGSAKSGYRPHGPSILLKIRLRPWIDNAAQTTAFETTSETYLGDVLDQICKKRGLDRYQYVLRLPGTSVLAPPDRTVESLGGRTELELVKKRPNENYGTSAPSSSPNAPIMAGDAGSPLLYMPDIITNNTYQKWIVWRRQPMSFMGKYERILAIDGDYVHISPSESKTMFESPKTTSLHIGSILNCKQSSKMAPNFKIVVTKHGQTKRYDFETTSKNEAGTIVNKIRTLMRNAAYTARSSRIT